MNSDAMREVIHGVIRETLDHSALMHTSRSIGDIASGRVADDVLAALDERHFEIVYVGPGDMP